MPAPATVKLLGDAPIYGGAVQKELVTPTGALIATTYASSFGPIPAMSVERVGYGAGDRDDPSTPNVLRVLIGRAADAVGAAERVTVIECEIDDMNPQIFGVVDGSAVRRRRARGVLRAGADEEEPARHAADGRRAARRSARRSPTSSSARRRRSGCGTTRSIASAWRARSSRVETPLGAVRFKVSSRDGRVVNAAPEFDDCATLAAAHNLSVQGSAGASPSRRYSAP